MIRVQSANTGKKWRESDTIKFVELYEQAECLWNFRHPAYRNRNARDKAIHIIIKNMNLPDFGVNELKNKIKNIRSTYQQEVNKIKRSKVGIGGDILEEYKTNLAWFPIADRFLGTVINSSKSAAIKVDQDDSLLFQTSQPALFNLVETEMFGETDQEEDQKFSPSYIPIDHIKEEPVNVEYNGVSPQASKRRKLSNTYLFDTGERSEDFDFQSTTDATQNDEWYHFGNNVACQLRSMPLENALACQKRIMDILIQERITSLKTEKEEPKETEAEGSG